jgi:hypothetical protein
MSYVKVLTRYMNISHIVFFQTNEILHLFSQFFYVIKLIYSSRSAIYPLMLVHTYISDRFFYRRYSWSLFDLPLDGSYFLIKLNSCSNPTYILQKKEFFLMTRSVRIHLVRELTCITVPLSLKSE